MNIPRTSFPRVVIIGGGFAGISIAKQLKNQEVQAVLIDKHNYHTFQPLLYQVSTGGLEPDSIAYPLRKIIKDYPNFYFRLTNVEAIDTVKKCVCTDIGDLDYDQLIIATGSATNYFGKIETPILMEITGHSRESTFLSYIGENPNKDAVADVFMERLRRLGNEG